MPLPSITAHINRFLFSVTSLFLIFSYMYSHPIVRHSSGHSVGNKFCLQTIKKILMIRMIGRVLVLVSAKLKPGIKGSRYSVYRQCCLC
ncbi:hypothetical protein BDB00DRAFT_795527 [Zychaea mexicana]|uniref:uncharacterized protein n=1 Tax=Zychaea mexicana TaxID=64656 RepID=UPI0022FDBCFF|nr:uncharacterized protein BDB00DRAFT_795527 [Zychaea mexicana]KAI9499119.1 hypothetical protein BDB00DRAFT_795527 [Zychaea mexicana]